MEIQIEKLNVAGAGDAGGGSRSSFSVDEQRGCRELLVDIHMEGFPKPTTECCIYRVPKECCIYRVPKRLRKINEEAYTPQVISIGPFHHGKPELAYMEKQKIQYERKLRERISPSDHKWERLESYVRENVERISNCYAEIPKFGNGDGFVRMILLDAVFIIEYLLIEKEFKNDRSDCWVSTPWLDRSIEIDLLLLENQLPIFVLEELYKLAFDGSTSHDTFLELCCSSRFGVVPDGVKIKHFTDMLRCDLVNPSLNEESEGPLENVPNAVKLHESELKFKPIKDESKSLFDIEFRKKKHLIPCFKVDELHMPYLNISYDTECLFVNIMVLEQCHYPSETHFCNYVNLLDKLINTEKDIDLLVEKGILDCNMGDHSAAADMVNKLGQNMLYSPSCFFRIAEDLKNHYHSPWNRAQTTLASVYFSNPWRGTATIAAIILMLLTIVQTACSVISLFSENVR